MNNTNLLQLATLIKKYLHDDVQYDESPKGDEKRLRLKKSIIKLAKEATLTLSEQ